MDSENKLTPFAKARLNINKTAENFNFYNSVEMLAIAIDGLKKASSDEPDELDIMCNNIIKELCAFMLERDGTWN